MTFFISMNKKKLIIIRQKFQHMGIHSGYDRAFESLTIKNNGFIKLVSIYRNTNGFLNFLFNPIAQLLNIGLKYYNGNSLITEVVALSKAVRSNSIIHITYLEDSYRLLAIASFFKNVKLIGTIHQPIKWWLNKKGLRLLSRLDKIVLLNKNDQRILDRFIKNKTIFIPHGVDTIFFCPRVNYKANKIFTQVNICCVGGWLRDWILLKEIFLKLQSEFANLKLYLVVPSRYDNNHEFQSLITIKNVKRYKDINDFELKNIYQNSTLFVLPLIAGSANNALLEAMSCGLPIVATKTAGAVDYTNPGFAKLVPRGENNLFYSEVLILLRSNQKLIEYSQKAREYSLKFDWRIIQQQLNKEYNKLFEN